MKRLPNGVTLIELLVVIAIMSVFVVPVFITYSTSRNNQAIRTSAESLSNILKTAHIYAREAKDQRSWAVRSTGTNTYEMANGTCDQLQTVTSYRLESNVSFANEFSFCYEIGTGDTATRGQVVMATRTGRRIQLDVYTTGIVELNNI